LKDIESANAFILAGGKSRRFGEDKALLLNRGKRFIDIVIESAAVVCSAVYTVGREYGHPRLSGCYKDEISGIGPIGGIHTALKHTDTNMNFFVGIDYPFIDPGIIRYLLAMALDTCSHYDGLVPVMPDGAHPLFAFYKKICLHATEKCISNNIYRLRCIAGKSSIHHYRITPQIEDPAFSRFQKNFININHYSDYMKFIRHFL